MKHEATILAILISATVLLSACAPTVNAAAPGLAPAASPVTAPSDVTLSPSEIEALNLALQDEFKALATYEHVIADFGAVRPFISIARAEEQHIAALTALYAAYGLDVPANEWAGQGPSFDSLAAACQAGVDAEVENLALYDQLFSMTDNADILAVFTSLQSASQDNHLLAFEQCVARY